MFEAYNAGGWGMYPITIWGVIALVGAFAYATRPKPEGRPVVAYLSLITLLTGVLGTTMGFLHTMIAAGHSGGLNLVLTGFGESLYCMAQTFIFLVLTLAIAGVGAVRAWRKAV